jgi:hypothetical protein
VAFHLISEERRHGGADRAVQGADGDLRLGGRARGPSGDQRFTRAKNDPFSHPRLLGS